MTDVIATSVSEYMARIGSEGGKKGGKTKGPQKARPPEHYRKMVEARNAQRAKIREQKTAIVEPCT